MSSKQQWVVMGEVFEPMSAALSMIEEGQPRVEASNTTTI